MNSIPYYRPQRSCEGLSVCPRGEGVSVSVHGGYTPPQGRPPGADTTPRSRPPQSRHPFQSRHPPGADTPQQTPLPQEQTPQPRETATAADSTHPTGMHSCYF